MDLKQAKHETREMAKLTRSATGIVEEEEFSSRFCRLFETEVCYYAPIISVLFVIPTLGSIAFISRGLFEFFAAFTYCAYPCSVSNPEELAAGMLRAHAPTAARAARLLLLLLRAWLRLHALTLVPRSSRLACKDATFTYVCWVPLRDTSALAVLNHKHARRCMMHFLLWIVPIIASMLSFISSYGYNSEDREDSDSIINALGTAYIYFVIPGILFVLRKRTANDLARGRHGQNANRDQFIAGRALPVLIGQIGQPPNANAAAASAAPNGASVAGATVEMTAGSVHVAKASGPSKCTPQEPATRSPRYTGGLVLNPRHLSLFNSGGGTRSKVHPDEAGRSVQDNLAQDVEVSEARLAALPALDPACVCLGYLPWLSALATCIDLPWLPALATCLGYLPWLPALATTPAARNARFRCCQEWTTPRGTYEVFKKKPPLSKALTNATSTSKAAPEKNILAGNKGKMPEVASSEHTLLSFATPPLPPRLCCLVFAAHLRLSSPPLRLTAAPARRCCRAEKRGERRSCSRRECARTSHASATCSSSSVGERT